MKNSSINVEFRDPVQEIKEKLQYDGAGNICINRGYNGEVEIRYSIKCADPEKEIVKALEQAGAKNIRTLIGYCGAKYEYCIDDIVDERDFKRSITDALRRLGYRAN